MSRLERDRAAAHAASLASQADYKRLNTLYDAAPDMLAALQSYEAWADKTICKDVELSGIRKQIRAAIARATGEQP